ncbi:hypothetical protein IAR50_000933 [Cryptococcus sp. DSM 104548]
MLGYYTSKRRKSSSVASPPSAILQSPVYGDAIHDSPASTDFASPSRPQQGSPPASSRGRVQSPNTPITFGDGDVGPRGTSPEVPNRLVAARDFAKPPRSEAAAQDGPSGQDFPSTFNERERSTINSPSTLEEPFVLLSEHTTSRSTLPNHPPRSSNPINAQHVPPPSVHDAYVSSFIKPSSTLDTRSEHNRPSIHRSSSAPGDAPHPLLPSALPSSPEKKTSRSKAGIPQPVFEIFNAELSEEGDMLCRNMRGHLERVFKGQEQVAKMHLALEGLGGDDGLGEADGEAKEGKEGDEPASFEKAFEAREKGVDEIMQKLDALADSLRTYHDLGTPRLSFQHPHPQSARPRTATVDLGALPHHPSFALPRENTQTPGSIQTSASSKPSQPPMIRSHSDVELSPLSKDPERIKSPLRNAFIPSSAVASDDEDQDQESAPAPRLVRKGLSGHLPPLRLSREPSLATLEHGKGREKTFWEREQEMDREKAGRQTWLEDAGGITDSPVEMGTRGQRPF